MSRKFCNKDKFDRNTPIVCFHYGSGLIRLDSPELKREGPRDVNNPLGVNVSLGKCFTLHLEKA